MSYGRKRSQLACLALMSMLTACSSADPLKAPIASEVLSIDATISNSHNSVHIDDPKRISEILGVFGELNQNMSVPFGTFPTPTHSIVVNDLHGTNLVIFVGLDWIGGKNLIAGKAAEDRATHVTESPRAAFLKAVGIDDYRFK